MPACRLSSPLWWGFQVDAEAETEGAGKATLGEREAGKHSTAKSLLFINLEYRQQQRRGIHRTARQL